MPHTIHTGRRVKWVAARPDDIANERAQQIQDTADRQMFQDTYVKVRRSARRFSRYDGFEDAMAKLASLGSGAEAAVIEALAAFRAEGVRL